MKNHILFPGIGCLLFSALALAQEPEKKLNYRYLYEVNAVDFPQATPREALNSLIKALHENRFEYLVAQLADPGYVDPRISEYKKAFPEAANQAKTLLAFRRLVKETSDHVREDPILLKEIRLFNKEAEWEVNEDRAVGTVKQIAGRHVIFRRYEERWFLENKQSK